MNKQVLLSDPAEFSPVSTSLLSKWLAKEPEFNGIGKGAVRKLVRAFGSKLHSILSRGDPQPLIPIVGSELAFNVSAVYMEKVAEAATIVWLDANGFDSRLAFKLAKIWGDATVSRLKENPYLMLTFSGWDRVDNAARRMGIKDADQRRLIGAVEAAVYERLDQKHTFSGRQCVLDAVRCKLGVSQAVASLAVEEALLDHAVVADGDGLQPIGAAVMERFIADRIKRLRTFPTSNLFRASASDDDIDFTLARFERTERHLLTPEQRNAVKMGVREHVSILTGGAGVGKTTVLKALCFVLEQMGCNVIMTALAGRAAKRITELTGRNAMTIAACLQALRSRTLKIGFDAIVVIDEASMLDLPTLYRLARGLPDHVRLLFSGDPYQIPPIGFGLTFHLWADSGILPTVRLTQVHRQVETTGIPAIAQTIREGRMPCLMEYGGRADGVSFIEMPAGRMLEVLPSIVSDLGRETCRIISPLKRGTSGVEAINACFHRLLEPGRASVAGGRICAGEPVIWTRNDWRRGFMNGSIGRLNVANTKTNSASVELDGVEVGLSASDWSFVDLAYAVTVHKAQGSQFERVILPITPSRLLDRALLYTAVTRGVRQVVVIGDRSVFNRAVIAPPHSHQREVGSVLRLDRRP